MKAAALRVFSWIMVIALVAPLALPTTASSAYVELRGGKKPLVGATPGAEVALDYARMPEERISRTAVSQPITMTQASTAIAPYAVESIPSPLLTIDADTFQVLPGDVITYSVAITNVADVPLTSVVLSDTLPAGVVYVAQSAVGFSYSLRDNRLTWALGALAPGQAVRGRFQLRATALGIGTLITNTVSAASANAPAVTASAVVEVAPPRQNRVWATPGEGGWLRSVDRRWTCGRQVARWRGGQNWATRLRAACPCRSTCCTPSAWRPATRPASR